MVCSLGSGRMAAMARLLAAGSVSQTIAEEVGQRKLAAHYIHKELCDADEPNLLNEEDMHVFDLKPMTDPLHLVRCNACKKPVKASQYAVHAELCKSLSAPEEVTTELDGGTGHKKPPRKERKKLLTTYANQASSIGEQERVEVVDGNDSGASESHLRNSLCIEGALATDGSGVSPGNTAYSASAMAPPTKRYKLIAAEGQLKPDHLETASGVTKCLSISTQEALTCGEYRKGSSAGSEKTCDPNLWHQMPGQVRGSYLQAKAVPAPLATKIFYSQRNNRLRSALSYLYYEASTKDQGGDLVNLEVLQENDLLLSTAIPKNLPHIQSDDQQGKKPDKILAQSSEVFLEKSVGCPPATTFSNQLAVNNVLGPHTPVGMIGSNYISNPYAFANNTGLPLGTLQQPKGSVHVI